MAAGLERPGDELYCPSCEQTFERGDRCPTDNTRLVRIAVARDQLIGRELDGRYTIVAQIGAGGMGAVYRGTQHQLGREVAIKVVKPSLVKEPLVIKRFLREAKLASRLSHPNALSVLDFGQTEDGLFFLVMELVSGRTLEDIVATDGKLTPSRIVRIGAQVCDALEGAHALQIIHRDLKPQNVMVMATGRDLVKVLDFGLAKSLSPEQGKTTMTYAGALLGTPAFMPPELVLGQECDARADLYSLGCVLYVCASGRPPFPSSSVHEVIAMHATEPVAPIDDIPPKLWAVIERLLQKDPADRYQTANAAREALEEAAPERFGMPEIGDTMVVGSSTILGWNGAAGLARAPDKRPDPRADGRPARVATLGGPQNLSDVSASVFVDEADLFATVARLPTETIKTEVPASQPFAAATPAFFMNKLGWKPIVLVAGAVLAAAVVAFALVAGIGGRSAAPATVEGASPPSAPDSTGSGAPADNPAKPAASSKAGSSKTASSNVAPAKPSVPPDAAAPSKPLDESKPVESKPGVAPSKPAEEPKIIAPLKPFEEPRSGSQPAAVAPAKPVAKPSKPVAVEPAKTIVSKPAPVTKQPATKTKPADKPVEAPLRRP